MSITPDAVFQFGNTAVAVVPLPLIDAPTPTMLVSANNWLSPEPGSVASVIMTRAGDEYATDLRAAVAQSEEDGIPPGAAVPIRGYGLADEVARQAVINVVTTVYPIRGSFENRIPASPQTVYAAVRNGLAVVASVGAPGTSLSLIGVRPGYGSEAPPVMAAALARALFDHLTSGVKLDGVLICETDPSRRALACEALAAVERASQEQPETEGATATDDAAEAVGLADHESESSPPVLWLSRAQVEESEELYGWPLPDWLPLVAPREPGKGLGLPLSAMQAITILNASAPAPVPGTALPDGVVWNPAGASRFLQFGCGWLTSEIEEAKSEGNISVALGMAHLLIQVARQWHETEPLGLQPLVQLATGWFEASEVFRSIDPVQAVGSAYRGVPFARAAATVDPENPHACLILGRYAVFFNQTEAARASLGRVLELAPGSPQADLASVLLESLTMVRSAE